MAGWSKDVGAITLFVEDLGCAKSFYQDIFELTPVYEDENSALFKFGNTMIDLLKVSEAPGLISPGIVGQRDAGSRFQLSIFVHDVDAVCNELTGRGVELLNGPMNSEWGMRTAAFVDPDGHIWEVAQDLSEGS